MMLRDPEWQSLQRAYQGLSTEQLMDHLSRINSLLEQQARLAITQDLGADIARSDQPAIRSPLTGAPSPPQVPAPRPSPTQPISAFDRYLISRRVGPRVAARIIRGQARAHARRLAQGRE
jgi:hypothetical protein